MLFQGRIDRAMNWIHSKSGKQKKTQNDEERLPSMEDLRAEMLEEDMELEKGDFFAMLLSALIVIVPACLLVLLFMCGFMFFI